MTPRLMGAVSRVAPVRFSLLIGLAAVVAEVPTGRSRGDEADGCTSARICGDPDSRAAPARMNNSSTGPTTQSDEAYRPGLALKATPRYVPDGTGERGGYCGEVVTKDPRGDRGGSR